MFLLNYVYGHKLCSKKIHEFIVEVLSSRTEGEGGVETK